MTIWAIADLHLSFGVPEKTMEVFGPEWKDYGAKIKSAWGKVVDPEDLILVAGDISWAMRGEQAEVDLQWIEALPGTKVLIKGNHDYWWSSLSKAKKLCPPSIHLIQNNSFTWGDYSIGGARLWDTDEYSCNACIEFRETSVPSSKEEKPDQERLYNRELERLELSLKALDQKAAKRLVMTHYPPLGLDMKPTRASQLLEKYNVDVCVFGHLHSVKKETPLFGELNGIEYHLTSCDYLDFKPLRLQLS